MLALDITMWTFETIAEVGGIILLIYILRVWKTNRNPIDLGMFFLVMALWMLLVTRMAVDRLILAGIDLNPYVRIGNLEIFDILYMVYGVVFGWFILYIYELKRIYTLPVVAGFFIEMYILLTDNRLYHNIFVTFVVLGSSGVLLYQSIKNHNGTTFGIFSAAILGVVEYYFGIWWLSMVSPTVIIVLLYLGVSGWFDNHVFFDRAKRAEIQSSWISRVVC